MAALPEKFPDNALIRGLPRAARLDLLASCVLRQLAPGAVLSRARQLHGQVIFPVSCVLAAMAPETSAAPLALLLLGRRDMLGASLCLGVRQAVHTTSVLLPGGAWCIGRGDFLRQLQANPSLQRTAKRQVFLQSREVAATAACAHHHHLQARLALWLLKMDSEVPDGHFHATHLQLARLLGVQRAAVSIAASQLRDRGAIHYSRGDVHMDRRERLERAACRCYGEYRADRQDPLR